MDQLQFCSITLPLTDISKGLNRCAISNKPIRSSQRVPATWLRTVAMARQQLRMAAAPVPWRQLAGLIEKATGGPQ